MNIEDMIMNGASDEEVLAALNAVKAEKKRQEDALRAQLDKEQVVKAEKEALKTEGRAYAINAIICYSKAFDLLDEGDDWDEEDVAKAEQMLLRIEEMIPLYAKMMELQNKMDEDFFGDSFGFGLGGLK